MRERERERERRRESERERMGKERRGEGWGEGGRRKIITIFMCLRYLSKKQEQEQILDRKTLRQDKP